MMGRNMMMGLQHDDGACNMMMSLQHDDGPQPSI
jgi:hypothetical protein